jgi:hypothetical protein
MQKVQGLTRNVLVPEAGVDHGEKQRLMAQAATPWAASSHPLVPPGRRARSARATHGLKYAGGGGRTRTPLRARDFKSYKTPIINNIHQ